MTGTTGYRILLGAALLFLASPIVAEPGFASGVDSGISGVVVRAGCAQPLPCRAPATHPSYVQVARAGGGGPVTARIRDLRFHVALRPGTYLVRLVRTAQTVGTGGRVVAVQPHAYTLVVLRT